MFASVKQNQAKTPSVKSGHAEPASRGETSPEFNPTWEALAVRPLGVQHKLAIGQPDDPYEQEADRVADHVMRMPARPSSNASREIQRKCAPCEEEDEKKVMRKEESSATDSPATAPPIVNDVLNSSGQPLEPETRSFMEERFNLNFARVRVHDNAQAAASAASVQALAYTVGSDIVFGRGQYAPSTSEGRHLLAHELSHVAQQRGAQPRIQRQTLKLRNGNEVGVPSGGTTANIKSEAADTLKRLLDLWAIEVQLYNDTLNTTWKNYGPSDVINASDLKPLTDAITKSETPSLAAPVANNFLNLNPPIQNSVGAGSTNDAKEVKAVQTALIAHGFMPGNSASGTVDAATENAIKQLKKFVASGIYGLDPLRTNEKLAGGDRFAGGTFRVLGDPVEIKVPAQPAKGSEPAKPATTTPVNKTLTLYVSSKVPPDKNKVHLFFTPLLDELTFVNEQGLRSEHEGSDWILMAMPGLYEHLNPNFITVTTAEIQNALSKIGRSTTTIHALRLSAHSRGHRGLERTMGFGGSPLIDLNLVERVSVFDASYKDLGTTLTSHIKDLPKMQDPANAGAFAAGTVNLYDVTVANISGLKGKKLDVSGIRALSYLRFVQEGLIKGKIDKIDIDTLKSDPKKDVRGATNRLLDLLKNIPRGTFSTRSPTPTGFTDLPQFLSANKADLTLVDDAKDGLSPLVSSERLDFYAFDLRPSDPNRTLTPHHWLAAELGHESVD